MEAYNRLIENLVCDPGHLVYCYPVGERQYYAVRGRAGGTEWLAIFDAQGVLETAFPPGDIDGYLTGHGFEYLGTVGEVLS
jgi:hypothetical protein